MCSVKSHPTRPARVDQRDAHPGLRHPLGGPSAGGSRADHEHVEGPHRSTIHRAPPGKPPTRNEWPRATEEASTPRNPARVCRARDEVLASHLRRRAHARRATQGVADGRKGAGPPRGPPGAHGQRGGGAGRPRPGRDPSHAGPPPGPREGRGGGGPCRGHGAAGVPRRASARDPRLPRRGDRARLHARQRGPVRRPASRRRHPRSPARLPERARGHGGRVAGAVRALLEGARRRPAERVAPPPPSRVPPGRRLNSTCATRRTR